MSEDKHSELPPVKPIPFSDLKPGMVVYSSVDCDEFTVEEIGEVNTADVLISVDGVLSWVNLDSKKKKDDDKYPTVLAWPVEKESEVRFATQLDAIRHGLANDIKYHQEILNNLIAIKKLVDTQAKGVN